MSMPIPVKLSVPKANIIHNHMFNDSGLMLANSNCNTGHIDDTINYSPILINNNV